MGELTALERLEQEIVFQEKKLISLYDTQKNLLKEIEKKECEIAAMRFAYALFEHELERKA